MQHHREAAGGSLQIRVDVRKEPTLLQLNGEQLGRGTNVNDEARLYISATGFWTPGQRVF